MDPKTWVKYARYHMNQLGTILLIYYAIMNVVVTVFLLGDMVLYMAANWPVDPMALVDVIMDSATANGWGYLLSMAIGALILLLWKKPAYYKNVIFARNRKMTGKDFILLLAVFLCGQGLLQVMVPALEWLLNQIGLSAMAAMEVASIQTTGLSMFLYVSFLGPLAEELLFRGLLLRILEPYGKQPAIFFSALLFGLFHGNIVQIPFAFIVGLVLAYVAIEYSITWAILLHVINNFVLADLMGRLDGILPTGVLDGIFYGILGLAAVVTVIVLIIRRKEAAAYLKENNLHPLTAKAFFTSPTVLAFAIMMLLTGLMTITPV